MHMLTHMYTCSRERVGKAEKGSGKHFFQWDQAEVDEKYQRLGFRKEGWGWENNLKTTLERAELSAHQLVISMQVIQS